MIKILNPGLLTSIQDKGRYGLSEFGVPVAGAMDPFAYKMGNILVGNEEMGSLEITMMGPTIEFLKDSVIAITGGDLSPKINGQSIPMWESILVKAGQTLSFGAIQSGCRAYIAFAGGLDVPKVMGSYSTYMKAKIGGHKGRALKKGDEIPVLEKNDVSSFIGSRVPKEWIPSYESTTKVRVLLGPQQDHFTKEGINTFLNSTYQVTNECDRMGFRLDGDAIDHKEGADIISDGIAFGAIQIPGHGKPIIMMADRQTTGGYTKIGNVIYTDLSKIAQLKPNDAVCFEKVDIKQAQSALKEQAKRLKEMKALIQSSLHKSDNIKEYNIKINGCSYNVKVQTMKG